MRGAQLELEVRRGQLIDRGKVERSLFAFGRMLRDRWQAWPARIGGEGASVVGVGAGGASWGARSAFVSSSPSSPPRAPERGSGEEGTPEPQRGPPRTPP